VSLGQILDADKIKEIICQQYNTDEWVVLKEVRTNTGYKSKYTDGYPFTEKYIDIMVLNCWPSKGYLKIAFEIKLTKNDFINELKKPEKRWLAMMYSNEFYFVVPKEVLDWRDIPWGCGLIEVIRNQCDGEWQLKVTKKAPLKDASPLPEGFIMSMLRNAYRTNQ